MLFSYKWLKEYVKDLPSPKVAADRLTMSGTEVEAVSETGGGITGVVTAEIVSRERHPNADRLSLCEVKTDKENFSIVCGADNMKAGDRVALALPGAELPGGFKIKKSKIRGVESCGMMCSEKELGLKVYSEGILILPKDTPLGVDLREALGIDDAMLEVSITPNRADLLSIKGLARELAALTSAVFIDKEIKAVETGGPIEKNVSIAIENNAPCPRYAARVIEGVKIGPSPEFIRQRLEAAGIRSINNAVDITNYALLELGQPLHAFDLDKIRDRRITVRLAKEGERIETIDNKTRQLSSDMLVIADGVSPVAIAGVMGGKGSEVSDGTANILLESAFLDPSIVRRQSRKLGLSSDSSYRFERGVDIDNVTRALDMAAGMMKEYCNGQIAKGVIDLYQQRFQNPVIRFRLERAAGLLGIPIEKDAAIKTFKYLGMAVKEAGHDTLEVTAPSYRVDIKNETDLIEEIARLSGYDKIPAAMPVVSMTGGSLGRRTLIRNRINSILTDTGFFEVVNYSFVSPALFALAKGHGKDGIRLINPLSDEQSVMRAMLIPSLLANLRQNLFQKNEEARIFEFAPVFLPGAKGSALPLENWKVSGLMYGQRVKWNAPKEPLDFYEVKGVVETLLEAIGVDNGAVSFERMDNTAGYAHLFHPGKSAVVKIARTSGGGGKGLDPFKGLDPRKGLDSREHCGVFGETHPDIAAQFDLKGPAFLFELDVDALIDASAGIKKYKPLPKFPESSRDIAFIVNEDVPYGDILNAIHSLDTKLIENVELFDVYCGGNIQKGMRSMAIRIRYRSLEGTLTQEEVEDVHAKAGKALAEKFNAVIRSGLTPIMGQ